MKLRVVVLSQRAPGDGPVIVPTTMGEFEFKVPPSKGDSFIHDDKIYTVLFITHIADGETIVNVKYLGDKQNGG